MLRGICVRWLGPTVSLAFYTLDSDPDRHSARWHVKVSTSTLFCFTGWMFNSPHLLPSCSSSHLPGLQVSVSHKMMSYRLHTRQEIYCLIFQCFTGSLIHMAYMSLPHTEAAACLILFSLCKDHQNKQSIAERAVCTCSESKGEKERPGRGRGRGRGREWSGGEMLCCLQNTWQLQWPFLLVSILAGLNMFPMGTDFEWGEKPAFLGRCVSRWEVG